MRSYVPKLNTKLFAGLRTQTGHQTGLPCKLGYSIADEIFHALIDKSLKTPAAES